LTRMLAFFSKLSIYLVSINTLIIGKVNVYN